MSKSSNHSVELNGTQFCITAKLRRLKIQENVLTSSVNKSLSAIGLEDEDFTTFKAIHDFKKYESTLQNTLIEIKNLLEDVKIATDTQGNIETLDIDEVKRDVLGLEEKIRTFKTFLRNELSLLKNTENEIQQELFKKKEKKELKKPLIKSSAKKFTEIVPSPVRILRNSPFKSPEVQRFQEFLSASKRYNGWNEYNHNIFKQIWNKYFNSGNNENPANIDNGFENTDQFYQFKDEVTAKITGVTSVDITSHYKWYTQYVYLKNKQQEALEKWKEDKQKIRKPGPEAKQVSRSNGSSESSNTDKRFSKQTRETFKIAAHYKESYGKSKTSLKSCINNPDCNTWSNKCNDNDNYEGFSRLLKSTEQWRNKCQGGNDKLQLFFVPTEKRQLGIPSWRLGLQDL